MKSFKNHFFMLAIIAMSIFHTNFIHPEAEFEESTVTSSPNQKSASFFERLKQSELNTRLSKNFNDLNQKLSDRVNNFTRNTNDFFFKKYSKSEPDKNLETSTKNSTSQLNFKSDTEGLEPAEPVNYGAGDLPDEEFSAKPDTHEDWDITSDEDKYLKAENKRSDDFKDKFGKQRSSWKNIFKSDSDLLETYLTDPSARDERLEEPEVRTALAKLSRTQTAELFTKITQNEIQQMRRSSADINLTPEEVKQLYIDMFNKNEPLFKQILKDSDPANTKQFILIPSIPKTISANSLVNFKFEVLDMSSYDPNLTVAENAVRMKKSQDLSIQANRFSPKDSTGDLATYIKNYLEDNPNTKNLKALLVNDFTVLNRTTSVPVAQAELAKILDSSEKMKSLFRNLTADQLTDITKAQIKAQERNMNLAGKGAKVSHVEAQRIFKQNAEVYQRFTKTSNLIIPTEDGSRSNQNSLKFEIVDLSSIQTDLANLDYKNVDPGILDPKKSRDFHSQKNIKATDAMNKIIQKIKTEHPEIQLSDVELAKELIRYLRNNKIELPKQPISPTEALTKLASEKIGAEKVNQIIMEIRDASDNPYSEETTRKVNRALQELIYNDKARQ